VVSFRTRTAILIRRFSILSSRRVKAPASAAIPANAVTITGDLDGYYRVSGEGFVVKSRDGGKGLSVTLDVEVLKDINPEIEK
jgi:hypothetical protein